MSRKAIKHADVDNETFRQWVHDAGMQYQDFVKAVSRELNIKPAYTPGWLSHKLHDGRKLTLHEAFAFTKVLKKPLEDIAEVFGVTGTCSRKSR